MEPSKKIFMVSSCLVGLCTRYDATISPNILCQKRLTGNIYIPFCPEQLGGLPTPREAADIIGGDGEDVLEGKAKVLGKSGTDFTKEFLQGAKQVLVIASGQDIDAILMKARSPSCAVHGKIGVTAALLRRHGYTIEEY